MPVSALSMTSSIWTTPSPSLRGLDRELHGLDGVHAASVGPYLLGPLLGRRAPSDEHGELPAVLRGREVVHDVLLGADRARHERGSPYDLRGGLLRLPDEDRCLDLPAAL